MNEAQKKLRKWFRRHGWHTAQPSTGNGFWLWSPVEHKYSTIHYDKSEKTPFVKETQCVIELDRDTCDYITLKMKERKMRVYCNAQTNTTEYRYNEEDFGEWEEGPYIDLPAEDILKLAELIKAAQEDWASGRPSKNHLRFFERIAKSCMPFWVGRNCTYKSLKEMSAKR